MTQPRNPPKTTLDPWNKLQDLPTLLNTVKLERAAGRRIVLTNGCFDLLHPGHLHLLAQARALGDCLIVAINSDGSVRRLKGESRPVVPFRQRVLQLAKLSEVDGIVQFDDATPILVIEQLLPDVLVKGDDWAPTEVVGREVVEAAGGKVVLVPRLGSHSTSRLLRTKGIAERVDGAMPSLTDCRGPGSWPAS